jgi:hypothetical protein
MTPPPKRRLLVSDVMLLILAAAIGLAVYRLFLNTFLGGHQVGLPDLQIRTAGLVLVRMMQWIEPTLPVAAAWTVAVPALRVRRPRPSWRRVLRQPGTTACLAAIVGSLWALAAFGGTLQVTVVRGPADMGPVSAWFFFPILVRELFTYVGQAVAWAWFGQALSGCWRPVPNAIDRMGRTLGAYWILVGLVWEFRRCCIMITSSF